MKKKIIIVLLLLMGLNSGLKFSANSIKEKYEYPSLEEIVEAYEVDINEAEEILQRMKNEDQQYEKDVNSTNMSRSEDIDLYKKDMMIEEYIKNEKNSNTRGIHAGGGWYYVSTPIIQQQNNYYCGPASVKMALGARGVNKSQGALAGEIGTTSANGSSGRYMKNVLNKYVRSGNSGRDWYVWRSMDSWDQNRLEYGVKLNIDNNFDPIMGVYQATGGSQKLVGHTWGSLRHFVTVTGYVNNGKTIVYNDPIHGYGGRFSQVPPHARISSYAMSYLVWGGSMIY